jgi:hypothetical protein
MRVLGHAQGAVRALTELQFGPKRRFGRRRVGKTEIHGIEGEIQMFLRAVRQIEAIADEQRLRHATNR